MSGMEEQEAYVAAWGIISSQVLSMASAIRTLESSKENGPSHMTKEDVIEIAEDYDLDCLEACSSHARTLADRFKTQREASYVAQGRSVKVAVTPSGIAAGLYDAINREYVGQDALLSGAFDHALISVLSHLAYENRDCKITKTFRRQTAAHVVASLSPNRKASAYKKHAAAKQPSPVNHGHVCLFESLGFDNNGGIVLRRNEDQVVGSWRPF